MLLPTGVSKYEDGSMNIELIKKFLRPTRPERPKVDVYVY